MFRFLVLSALLCICSAYVRPINYVRRIFINSELDGREKEGDRVYGSTSSIPKEYARGGLNVGRGLLQGGAFLIGGLLVTGENPLSLFSLGGTAKASSTYPIKGDESIMAKKGHGTGGAPVQKDLRWNCDGELADRICNFNRMWAENAGYFTVTSFFKDVDRSAETTFYDSVTGKALFVAPKGRTFEEFEQESRVHGWPSFRDEEVVWDNVRCLKDGECVSTTGTHLGHNLPDRRGNRYCINLVSVAGRPISV